LTTKQKIFELESKLYLFLPDTTHEEFENFWNQVLRDLDYFENFDFTRKMNRFSESLLELFFDSLLKFSGIFGKSPTQVYDTQTMIQLFQKIVDKTKPRLDRYSSRFRSPMGHLIYLNNFEFFEYFLSKFEVQKIPLHLMSISTTDPKIFSLTMEKFGMLELSENYFLHAFSNANLEIFKILTKDFTHPEYLSKINVNSWIYDAKLNYQDSLYRIEFCFEHTSFEDSKGLGSEQIKQLFTFGYDRMLLIPLFMKYKIILMMLYVRIYSS
jgi:hypothetical protein